MMTMLVYSYVMALSFGTGIEQTQSALTKDLERGAFFGAKIATLPEDIRERLEIKEGQGIVIEAVLAGATAEAAGFKPGDVLVVMDSAQIAGTRDFIGRIAGLKAGAACTFDFFRDGQRHQQKVTLKGKPFEISDNYDVVYSAVKARSGRLRTIVTTPKGQGKHKALFLIQGIATYSIDNPIGAFESYKSIIDDFARRGFVTLRVDKPGCGDSEGGPARDVDFDTELDGYRAALKMLASRDDVDADNIFLFGHSIGGVMAPLLAMETPVRGIIVYGTIARTWTEYMLENSRRQMELAEEDPSAIDSQLKLEAALLTHLYLEKMHPKEIAEKYPTLRETLGKTITDDRYFYDRSLTFYSQLADKNLGNAWKSYKGSTLALWGKGDYVSNEDDHALIARIVNRYHPEHASFLVLDGIDHGFHRAESREESFQNRGRPGQFNPLIIETGRDWIAKISAKS